MSWLNDYALQNRINMPDGTQNAEAPTGADTLGAALEVASGLNPDQAARANRLAGELGATGDLVLAAPGESEQAAAAQRIRAYPSLANWAGRSAANAALVREEPEALGGILDGIKGVAGGALSFFPKTAGGLGKFASDTTGFLWGVGEFAGGALGLEGAKEYAGARRREAQGYAQRAGEFLADERWNLPPELRGDISENPKYLLSPTYWAYQGADALASIVPALMAAYTTGGASLTAQAATVGGIVGGAQEGAALYTDLMAAGDVGNVDALSAAVSMAGGSGLLNAVSFGKIFGALPPGARKKILDVSQTAVTEGATEWAENPLQAFLSGLARGDDAGKITSAVVAAAKDLNVIPGALLAGGGTRSAHVLMESRVAQSFVDQQLAVNAKVTNSQLYQRSPEKMRELLDSAGPVMSQVVTLPRAQLSNDVLTTLNAAENTDPTVSVPLSELHARLTPEAFRKVIPLVEPVDGQSLVTVRRKMEQVLAKSIGRAVQVRDIERAVAGAMGLDGARQATEDLRAGLRSETATLRNRPPESSPSEDSTGEEGLGETRVAAPGRGLAYADAQAVETFFQTALSDLEEVDVDSARLSLLEGLGVSPDVYAEAVADNGELEIDLNNLPQVANNPLWDGLIDHLDADSVEVTREMQADLKAMGPPPTILDRAGADVTPETRAELVGRLKAAGRSAAQSTRETELLARFASIRGRITGEDPNRLLKDGFKFGREAKVGNGITYYQDSEKRRKFDGSPVAELSGNEIFELIEPVNISKARKKAFAWARENGLYREDYQNTDTGWSDIAVREKGVEDSLRHGGGPQKIQTVAALPFFIHDGIFLETTTAHNEKQQGMKSHVFAAKVNIAGKSMVVGFVIKEDANGKRFYDHELTEIENLDGLVTHSGAIGLATEKAFQTRQGLTINIVQKHLGVNPDTVFEQSGQSASRGRAEFLDDGTVNIIFSQAQDASTAVHEFAHDLRELVGRIMSLPPDQIVDQAAFASLKEGWDAAELWLARFDDDVALKVEYDKYQKPGFGGRTFEDLTADEKSRVRDRAKHEHFARGFEAYLMEGVAPTSGLKKLFGQMKTWLVKLYGTVRGLDVELNDDVRRFFDRLLATDEELAVESWRADAAPTPDQLEMMREADPEAFAEYEAAAAKGREEAERQIIQARIDEREKAIRAWRREGKKAAKEDERTRRVDDIRKSGGVSLESLRALGYDDESIGLMQKPFPGLVREDGTVGLDEHAENLGLDGGEALFEELMNTPTLVQMEAQYVAEQEAEWEEYFDADLGITDAEIDAWEAEKNLWAKYMASKGSKYAPRPSRGLKAAIETQFDGLTVDEIKRRNSEDLRASLKAQARAAKEGYAAGEEAGRTAGLMAGVIEGTRAGRREAREAARAEIAQARAEGRANVDWAVAYARAEALEQRQELAARLREQAQRQRELAKFEAQARRLIRQKVAESAYRPGGIRPDFHCQIKNILAAAGLGREVDASESLADFVARLQADGAPVDVAPSIVSGSMWQKVGMKGQPVRRTYRGLTWEEFKDFRDSINNLTAMGRRQQQVRYDGALMSEDAAVASLLAAITANNETTPAKTPDEIFRERETGKKKSWFKTWFKHNAGLMPSTRKMQHLAYELDGQELNGVVQKLLYQGANQAHNTSIKLTTDWMNELRAIAEKTVGVDTFRGWAGDLIFIPEYNQSVRKSTIIMAALNLGNAQNLKALSNHHVFGQNLAPLLRKMGPQDWDYVQAVWDFFDNQSYPELNRLTLRTKGIPLPKVEAQPFVITLPDGQQRQMRGGYFPLIFDRELSTSVVVNSQIKAEEIKNMPGLYSPSEVQASSTIKRTGSSYKELVPDLNMAVMIRSLNETIQDLAYREAVSDTWRILKRPEVKAAIDGVFGNEAWPQMKIWLRNLTRGGTDMSEMRKFNQKARWIRGNTSVNAMGAKVSVLALQVTGISQSAQTLGWGWTLQGINQVFGHTSRTEIRKNIDEMYAKSPQLASRNQRPYDRDMYDSIVKGKDPLFKSWLQKWGESLFRWIGLSDQMVANAVWMGGYQKALHEGKSEADAIMDADAIISLTQAMGENKDMSYAQQGWAYGDLGKLATMFQTFYSSTGNLLWLANRQAQRDARQGNYGKSVKGFLRANWNLAIIPAIFSTLMWNGPDWPDDEKEAGQLAMSFARDIIGNMAGGLPVVRDGVALMADWAMGTGQSRFAASPIESAFVGAPRTLGAAYKAITEKENRLTNIGRAARGLGPFVPGIPGAQIATTLEGIDNWEENDGIEKVYRLLIREPNKK